jgi:hypothetical protein
VDKDDLGIVEGIVEGTARGRGRVLGLEGLGIGISSLITTNGIRQPSVEYKIKTGQHGRVAVSFLIDICILEE